MAGAVGQWQVGRYWSLSWRDSDSDSDSDQAHERQRRLFGCRRYMYAAG